MTNHKRKFTDTQFKRSHLIACPVSCLPDYCSISKIACKFNEISLENWIFVRWKATEQNVSVLRTTFVYIFGFSKLSCALFSHSLAQSMYFNQFGHSDFLFNVRTAILCICPIHWNVMVCQIAIYHTLLTESLASCNSWFYQHTSI